MAQWSDIILVGLILFGGTLLLGGIGSILGGGGGGLGGIINGILGGLGGSGGGTPGISGPSINFQPWNIPSPFSTPQTQQFGAGILSSLGAFLGPGGVPLTILGGYIGVGGLSSPNAPSGSTNVVPVTQAPPAQSGTWVNWYGPQAAPVNPNTTALRAS